MSIEELQLENDQYNERVLSVEELADLGDKVLYLSREESIPEDVDTDRLDVIFFV